MTNSVIEKKLQEVEFELRLAFSLPPQTRDHESISDDIALKLKFLKKLLSAEFASHPENPDHLDHIAKRIEKLEAAYHYWDEFRASAVDNLDSPSTCSCPESSLNGEDVYEEQGSVKSFDGLREQKGLLLSEENGRNWARKYFGAVSGGFVFGAAIMWYVMVKFFGCFGQVEFGGYTAPT